MPTAVISQFAQDVAEGLAHPGQKKFPPSYLYDELGSMLFEAITLVPEYGLTRADERLLRTHSSDIARTVGPIEFVAELGSGSGRKTKFILDALRSSSTLVYSPIDISSAALSACEKELGDLVEVRAICAEWMDGLRQASHRRRGDQSMLLMFLGSSIGNLDRENLQEFLVQIRSFLRPGDFFLLGADLVKNVDVMLAAYDDPTGVTAAFNLNLLGRMNRELGANFDLRSFAHEVRWNAQHRRIEMHLLSGCNQSIFFEALESRIDFVAGETIWTESSHKFTEQELEDCAVLSGFESVESWVDETWPFAEVLWRAIPK